MTLRYMLENALGLSYPKSRATRVTASPAANRVTAAIRQAC